MDAVVVPLLAVHGLAGDLVAGADAAAIAKRIKSDEVTIKTEFYEEIIKRFAKRDSGTTMTPEELVRKLKGEDPFLGDEVLQSMFIRVGQLLSAARLAFQTTNQSA